MGVDIVLGLHQAGHPKRLADRQSTGSREGVMGVYDIGTHVPDHPQQPGHCPHINGVPSREMMDRDIAWDRGRSALEVEDGHVKLEIVGPKIMGELQGDGLRCHPVDEIENPHDFAPIQPVRSRG